MREVMEELVLPLAGLVLGVVVAGAFVVGTISHLSFPAAVASIESLRRDAAGVDPAQAEDVIGQVVERNRAIASLQAQNKIPFWCAVVPSGWDEIEPIPVPQGGVK